jgi:hypothetical protein
MGRRSGCDAASWSLLSGPACAGTWTCGRLERRGAPAEGPDRHKAEQILKRRPGRRPRDRPEETMLATRISSILPRGDGPNSRSRRADSRRSSASACAARSSARRRTSALLSGVVDRGSSARNPAHIIQMDHAALKGSAPTKAAPRPRPGSREEPGSASVARLTERSWRRRSSWLAQGSSRTGTG